MVTTNVASNTSGRPGDLFIFLAKPDTGVSRIGRAVNLLVNSNVLLLPNPSTFDAAMQHGVGGFVGVFGCYRTGTEKYELKERCLAIEMMACSSYFYLPNQ